MSPRLYRNYISLVQQEPVLYQGSVRENICLGLDTDPTKTKSAKHAVKPMRSNLLIPCPKASTQPVEHEVLSSQEVNANVLQSPEL